MFLTAYFLSTYAERLKYNMNNYCDLSMINGNSIDIALQGCDSEIKADIVVSEFNSVRLWGQILNCDGEAVSNALLKLVKIVIDCNGKCLYQGIAHTVSDCNGFYQFDLCADDPCAKYKVLVNKSATGTERIIEDNTGNCQACVDPDYTPCGEYRYRVTPPDSFECPQTSTCTCDKCSKSYSAPQKTTCACKKNGYQGYSTTAPTCATSHVGNNVYAPYKVRF